MTTPDLKPCPFCGGSVSIGISDEGTTGAIECAKGSSCIGSGLLIGFMKADQETAIAAWNDRYSGPEDWIAEHKLFEAMLNEQAFVIREAALREAVAVAEALAVKWWHEYKDRLSPHCADPQYQGMSDGADDVATAIEALIGEQK